jgi:hypothetical protein
MATTTRCNTRQVLTNQAAWGASALPSTARSSPTELLRVRFGQRTFEAEGREESGRFFSRVITFPGGASSGVTIGRGYDMGQRSAAQVLSELRRAGVARLDALDLSRGAGLRGEAARLFVATNRDHSPTLSLQAQKNLFEDVVTPTLIADIQRIFNKPDTVRAYGRPVWEELHPTAQEIVFDLRYRGDYTPKTRQRIQRLLAERDYCGLKEVLSDTAYWARLGVPRERIKERQEMAESLSVAGDFFHYAPTEEHP